MTTRTVDGMQLPSTHPPTENELACLVFWRMITEDRDPPPSFAGIQALKAMGAQIQTASHRDPSQGGPAK